MRMIDVNLSHNDDSIFKRNAEFDKWLEKRISYLGTSWSKRTFFIIFTKLSAIILSMTNLSYLLFSSTRNDLCLRSTIEENMCAHNCVKLHLSSTIDNRRCERTISAKRENKLLSQKTYSHFSREEFFFQRIYREIICKYQNICKEFVQMENKQSFFFFALKMALLSVCFHLKSRWLMSS